VLTVKAYAKVNLTLEVLGKRDDGYHQIVSVMQTIDLSDELSFVPSSEIIFRCSLLSLETSDNLVLRAASLLKERTGYSGGIDIFLKKNIPVAAGLGGGSSDAAATLKALCRLWNLDINDSELQSLAASLGSDVPFFLLGGTAMAKGRGEEIHELPAMDTTHMVLLAPPMEMLNKTASMYGSLIPEDYTNGEASSQLRACIEGQKKSDAHFLFNVFEDVAFSLFQPLEVYRNAMLDAGASWVHLTGSGPAMYTFSDSKQDAIAFAEKLRAAGYEVYVATTVESYSKETLP
jgi:4-diphosphocytidyl-2-C-methyl-D-erythritol kinase